MADLVRGTAPVRCRPQARWRAYARVARIPGSQVASMRSSHNRHSVAVKAIGQNTLLAIPPQLDSTSEQGYATNVSISH